MAQDQPGDLHAFALELTNETRSASGLPALSLEPALTRAAQAHAEDMLRRGYFSHEAPEGTTALDRYIQAGGDRQKLVAENIAECRNCAARREVVRNLHLGWMESPGHRANILSPGVERFGFGIASGGGRLVAVQAFAGPGTSPGLVGAEGDAPADGAGQLRAALELVNAARQEVGSEPLRGSAALSEGLGEFLAANANRPGAEMAVPSLSSILSALPDGERAVTDAALLAGQCGGCGARPAPGDIPSFVKRWLADAEYRATLLDPRWSELGVAVDADGEGGKRALAILSRPSS